MQKLCEKKISTEISDISRFPLFLPDETMSISSCHHIHVKCGDDIITLVQRDSFIDISRLMDVLVHYITGDNK